MSAVDHVYRLAFIIEQALGHVTHGQNLRLFVSQDPSVQAHWGFPSWAGRGWAGRLPALGGNWTVQAGLQTRRLLAAMQRQARPQALFFHTQVTAVLARDWLRRAPSVVSLDATPKQYDVLGAHYQHAAGPDWLEGIKYRLNRDVFRLARRLVTWSEWAKQGLVDEYSVPADKVTVIPPGVEPAAWQAPPRPPDAARPVKVLFVGAALERKGGRVLLEAFRRLSGDAQIELHLVTKDQVAPERGVSVHNGLQPNSPPLRRLYAEADIFCLPTLGDCLPVALAEAGAAGLPLVSTCVAAIPEIVQEGQTGLLVPPGDAEALASALRRLAADPGRRLEIGANAQALVRRRYDAEQNAARLLDLLKAVVDSPGGSRPRT